MTTTSASTEMPQTRTRATSGRLNKGWMLQRPRWAACLCAAVCGRLASPGERGGPVGGANAFALVPSPSPAVRPSHKFMNERFLATPMSCDGGRSSPSRRSTVVLAANRRPSSSYSMSSDVSEVADVVREERRQRQLPKQSFSVYDGTGKSSKSSEEVKAKIIEERRLGARIQESIRFMKIKQHLEEVRGEEISVEMWAQAVGLSVKALERTMADGDTARQSLVEMSFGLVKNSVYKYCQAMAAGHGSRGTGNAAEFSETDLVQEATMGLIRAAEKFDPTRGFRFCTYAQWWVRKYLNESLQNQNRLIRIPAYFAHRVTRVNRATQDLTAEFGRPPTLEELAVATGYTVPQVQDCQQQSAFGVASLDAQDGRGYAEAANGNAGRELGHGLNLVDVVASENQSVGGGRAEDVRDRDNAVYLQRELRADLSIALSRLLDDREKECLVLRYGLKDGVPRTLQETSRIMGMDLDEVDMLSLRSMDKLRDGTLPQERAKLISYLSEYEPESMPESYRRPNPNPRSASPKTVSPKVASPYAYRSRDGRVAEQQDNTHRDGGEHEQLEEELARYLRARGISKDFSLRNDNFYGELSLEELNLGSDRIPQSREEREAEERQTVRGSGGWSKDVPAEPISSRAAQASGSSNGSRYSGLGGDVGSGGAWGATGEMGGEVMIDLNHPRARFISEAEPRPNSREAMQLEDLSRLLFDGDEPRDFVFGQSTLQ